MRGRIEFTTEIQNHTDGFIFVSLKILQKTYTSSSYEHTQFRVSPHNTTVNMYNSYERFADRRKHFSEDV